MKSLNERVREHVNNPVFQKPISHLHKNYEQRGTIILVTKIRPQENHGKDNQQHATGPGEQSDNSMRNSSGFINRIQRLISHFSKAKSK